MARWGSSLPENSHLRQHPGSVGPRHAALCLLISYPPTATSSEPHYPSCIQLQQLHKQAERLKRAMDHGQGRRGEATLAVLVPTKGSTVWEQLRCSLPVTETSWSTQQCQKKYRHSHGLQERKSLSPQTGRPHRAPLLKLGFGTKITFDCPPQCPSSWLCLPWTLGRVTGQAVFTTSLAISSPWSTLTLPPLFPSRILELRWLIFKHLNVQSYSVVPKGERLARSSGFQVQFEGTPGEEMPQQLLRKVEADTPEKTADMCQRCHSNPASQNQGNGMGPILKWATVTHITLTYNLIAVNATSD